jgi:hypothetical protein
MYLVTSFFFCFDRCFFIFSLLVASSLEAWRCAVKKSWWYLGSWTLVKGHTIYVVNVLTSPSELNSWRIVLDISDTSRLMQCCSALWIERVAVRWMMRWYHWVFFFYWHYNPLWILAFSVILFHSAISSHCFLHRLIPIICLSSSISTIHLFLGLPLILVPTCFHSNILLGALLSSIRITWPSQAIILFFL